MHKQKSQRILSKIKLNINIWELVGSYLTTEQLDSDRQDDKTDIFVCGDLIGKGTQEIQNNIYSDVTPVKSPRQIYESPVSLNQLSPRPSPLTPLSPRT